MKKPCRRLAVNLSLFAFFAIHILSVCARAQTNAQQYDAALVQAAQALAASEPISPQTIPAPATNGLVPGLSGNYYFLQMTNFPPLPFPQWDLPTYLLDPTNGIYVIDDRSVAYDLITPPAFGIPLASFAMAGVFSPAPSPPACGTGGPAYITNFTATLASNGTTTVSFIIAGGSTNVIYDILVATNVASTNTQWRWLGQGFCCDTYTFYNQPQTQSYYRLGIPTPSLVVAWGDNTDGQCNVPPGLSNVVAVTGGLEFSLALKSDGTVAAWGDDGYGQTNIPSGLSNVVAIAAGAYHALALKADGTVSTWGDWYVGDIYLYTPAAVPTNLATVVGISAGLDHDLAILADGSIISWGYTNDVWNTVPTGLPAAVGVAAGWNHNVALLNNGSVTAWGNDVAVLGWDLTDVPPDLTNANAVSSIAAFGTHSVALRMNGTVESWGYDGVGQTNVPIGLSNVVAIATGFNHSMALKNDGTVTLWGQFLQAQTYVPQGLGDIVAIGAGGGNCLAVVAADSAPIILEEPASGVQSVGANQTLTALGYGSTTISYQWQFDGSNIAGATNASLVLTNLQASQFGNYNVVVSNAAGSIASSNATWIQLQPPEIISVSSGISLTNWCFETDHAPTFAVYATTLGSFPIYYQWQLNGTNIPEATEANYHVDLMNLNVAPAAYSVIVSNAAGLTNIGFWNVRSALPGMVAAWGDDLEGEIDNPPAPTNVTIINGPQLNFPETTAQGEVKLIAAGDYHGLAVQENGTVMQWGNYWNGDAFYPVGSPPSYANNLVEVAAGAGHDLGLTVSNTVVSWGLTDDPANFVPTNLSGVTAIAAAWNHNVALLTNGTVRAWGINGAVEGWNLTDVPASATNIIAISAQALHSLALKADGTVIAWGDNSEGETNVPTGLTNVVAIAAGGQHNLALKADGTVVAWGFNGYGQTNVPTGLSNVMAVAAGFMHSVALKNDGTVVAWGDNFEGQTNVIVGMPKVKLISACGDFSLAAIFAITVQYPLDVKNDLLLIYNTNSQDSSTVLNYYLANRPGVSNANVLGIGVINTNSPGYYETVYPEDYTNFIQNPVLSWLAANPTKRPEYVVLMLDVPSRVNSYTNAFPGTNGNYPGEAPPNDPASVDVSCRLNSLTYSSWQPLVTCINMNGTNDCIGYINKLASFGSNSPGKLIISARGVGYSDTTYYFDDARDPYYGFWPGEQQGQSGLSGLIGTSNSGVSLSEIVYEPYYATNSIALATNLAGYFSYGTHVGIYPNSYCTFLGDSSWYIMTTVESYNGLRYSSTQSSFVQWFSSNAFGGSGYSSTPIGAVVTVDEPMLGGTAYTGAFFGNWAQGRIFAIAAWSSLQSSYFQAVGDPFVTQ